MTTLEWQSVEKIYADALLHGHFNMFVTIPMLVSGIPERDPKDSKVSGVDCVIFGNPKNFMCGSSIKELINEKRIKFPNKQHPNVTIIKIVTYSRKIKVYVTDDLKYITRSLTHRSNEHVLSTVALKKGKKSDGSDKLDTEQAWAKVLGLIGDPYEQMARPISELVAIAKQIVGDQIDG
jgi:hypothetical protein